MAAQRVLEDVHEHRDDEAGTHIARIRDLPAPSHASWVSSASLFPQHGDQKLAMVDRAGFSPTFRSTGPSVTFRAVCLEAPLKDSSARSAVACGAGDAATRECWRGVSTAADDRARPKYFSPHQRARRARKRGHRLSRAALAPPGFPALVLAQQELRSWTLPQTRRGTGGAGGSRSRGACLGQGPGLAAGTLARRRTPSQARSQGIAGRRTADSAPVLGTRRFSMDNGCVQTDEILEYQSPVRTTAIVGALSLPPLRQAAFVGPRKLTPVRHSFSFRWYLTSSWITKRVGSVVPFISVADEVSRR